MIETDGKTVYNKLIFYGRKAAEALFPSKHMRLMHMMGGGDVGGAKTHILSLLHALRQKHEVCLVSFRDGPFPQEAAAQGIRVEVIKYWNIPRARGALLSVIREFQPDVIHCHGARANMMGAIVRHAAGVPVMTTVHSDYRLDYLGSPVRQCFFGTANAIALRHLDFYQPVADQMITTLTERGFDPQRMFRIYNGMDFSRSVTDMDRTAYFQENWGFAVSPDDVVCCTAARLTAVKDIGTAIRAFAKARESCPNLKFAIAGEGEEHDALVKLAQELGVSDAVLFAGWVSAVDRFFAACDINLLSSLSEGFPYSVLEGVREGCVTISTDVGGLSELIEPEENGFIFNPGEVDRLADYIVRLAQDGGLRQTFAARLYEKARGTFSIENMCAVQEDNYRRALACFHRDKTAREGVVVCGAYGKGNVGDEAILQSIVQEMREIDRDMPIWVLSRRPKETRVTYRVGALYIFNVPRLIGRLRRAKLYINGGGTLIQDVTSTRSLRYYLYTLRLAKRMGCKVMMFGCGIGPVGRPDNRRVTAKTLNAAVDLITLRDNNSLDELKSMCVDRPEILLSADPALQLRPAPAHVIDRVFAREGIPADGSYLGFAVRRWKGIERTAAVIAQAAEYAYEKYGVTPVFLPFEYPNDLAAGERVTALLHCPHYEVRQRCTIEETIGLLTRMRAVVAVRLHALMLAAAQGVPMVGLSYDIKIDGFLHYIGSDACEPFGEVTAEALCRQIDLALARDRDEDVQKTAQTLCARERENLRGAARLLEKNLPEGESK